MLAWTVIQLALVLQPRLGPPLRARPRPLAPLFLIASERDGFGARPVTPGSPGFLGWTSERVPQRSGRSREAPRDADAAAEYDLRVAEAQAAIAVADAARKRLAFQKRQRSEPPNGLPPQHTLRQRQDSARRCKVSRSDAGTLVIELPAAGLPLPDAIMGGAFSLAWFSAVVPATFSMMASGGGLFAGAFMLPFWLAGGVNAKQNLVEPARSTSISIGEFAWEISSSALGLPLDDKGGPTEELEGATAEVSAYVNGAPSYELLLRAGGGVYSFGAGLDSEELTELADAINLQISIFDNWRGREGMGM